MKRHYILEEVYPYCDDKRVVGVYDSLKDARYAKLESERLLKEKELVEAQEITDSLCKEFSGNICTDSEEQTLALRSWFLKERDKYIGKNPERFRVIVVCETA